MDHFQAPRNRGRLEPCDRIGIAGVVGQGPYVVFYVRFPEGCVTEARFECNGCGVTVAICSVVTELIPGRTVAECRAIAPVTVTEALHGLPVDKLDRVAFVLEALNNALK